MINEVIIGGLLSKYHDIKTTQTGKKMATFSLWQKKSKDLQQYVPVLAFDRQAEFFEKYVKDGMYLVCSGELSIRQQQGQDGKKYSSISFIADKIQICEGMKPKQETQTYQQKLSAPQGERFNDDMWSRSLDISNDELPF